MDSASDGGIGDVEDTYWSARVRQLLAKDEPTVPWSEVAAWLEAEEANP